MTENIPKIVLTGGPCAGKSTCLALLASKLPEYGVVPVFVPEVATMVLAGGVRIADMLTDPERFRAFERRVLLTQIVLEEQFIEFAELQPGGRKVLISDRGTMDVKAYMDEQSFSAMLAKAGLDEVSLRDMRYQAVLHLVTAANGATEYYNLDNPARHETLDEARERDLATLAAWTGHPYLRIIDNTRLTAGGSREPIGFEEKVQKVLREVCRALHVPVPIHVGKKFIVEWSDTIAAPPIPYTMFRIFQTYLPNLQSNVERKVRAREQIITGDQARRSNILYTYTEKRKVRRGVDERVERVISRHEYEALLREGSVGKMIRKTRTAFTWDYQYFQLDEFQDPSAPMMLEVDTTEEQEEARLPPFFKVLHDATSDDRWSNARVALMP